MYDITNSAYSILGISTTIMHFDVTDWLALLHRLYLLAAGREYCVLFGAGIFCDPGARDAKRMRSSSASLVTPRLVSISSHK